jgi:hypothetical protein
MKLIHIHAYSIVPSAREDQVVKAARELNGAASGHEITADSACSVFDGNPLPTPVESGEGGCAAIAIWSYLTGSGIR